MVRVDNNLRVRPFFVPIVHFVLCCIQEPPFVFKQKTLPPGMDPEETYYNATTGYYYFGYCIGRSRVSLYSVIKTLVSHAPDDIMGEYFVSIDLIYYCIYMYILIVVYLFLLMVTRQTIPSRRQAISHQYIIVTISTKCSHILGENKGGYRIS